MPLCGLLLVALCHSPEGLVREAAQLHRLLVCSDLPRWAQDIIQEVVQKFLGQHKKKQNILKEKMCTALQELSRPAKLSSGRRMCRLEGRYCTREGAQGLSQRLGGRGHPDSVSAWGGGRGAQLFAWGKWDRSPAGRAFHSFRPHKPSLHSVAVREALL